MESIIKQVGQDVTEDISTIVNKDQLELVRLSVDYLNRMQQILSTSKDLNNQEMKLQNAISQLQKQAQSIQDQQLDLLHLNQKALKNSRKSRNRNFDKNVAQSYRDAIKTIKTIHDANVQLNKAYSDILTRKNTKNQQAYMQKAIIYTERYRDNILRIINENVESKTVFQLHGEVFMIVNMNVAAKKLFRLEAAASSKDGQFVPRMRIPKKILTLDAKKLKQSYGLERYNISGDNKNTYNLMQSFLEANTARGELIQRNNYGVRRALNSQKYITAWKTMGKNGTEEFYKSIIGNTGDLSEIYTANLLLSSDSLKDEDIEQFLSATQVDNVSGALIGDFRKNKDDKITEFSSKSQGASYTIISQMQNLARQIIGLSQTGADVKNILLSEYNKQAGASSGQERSRNIIEKITKEEFEKIMSGIIA